MRSQLTVIVYPDIDLFRSRSKAPAWAGGLYDGGVHAPADPTSDLGVALATLRHEIMHRARLHYAVGCMPVWFNEGVASLFAGETPVHTWLVALREHDWFNTRSLSVSSVDEVKTEKTAMLYAQCLAMVVTALDQMTLRDLVVVLRYGDPPRRLELWERQFGNLDAHALLDALGRRLFGLPVGPDLDALLAAPVCCAEIVDPRAIKCHAAPPHDGRALWLDRTSTPIAACSPRW